MVELEVFSVIQAEGHPFPLVLLRRENRILPILVGEMEADAIHRGLAKQKMPRPMTHDLICNLLAGLHGEITSVVIYRLHNDTFFAYLNVEQKNAQGAVEQVLRIDSRPSDSIAIAVRVDCPIYVAEEVMEMAAQDASILEPEDDDDDGESFES